MAANTKPIFLLTPKQYPQTFVNADSTGKKTIATAGTNGSKIDGIKVCSDDTATVAISFFLSKGGTDYLIGSLSVSPGTGVTSGASPAEALEYLNDSYAIALEAGVILKASVGAAVTSGKTVTIVVHGGDF
jgi:hypothetical protein